MPNQATVIIESLADTAQVCRLVERTADADITQGCLIIADATNGDITLELPHSAAIDGRHFLIKKVDTSSNTVTIIPNVAVGSDTIEGLSSFVLNNQWDALSVTSYANADAWVIDSLTNYSNPTAIVNNNEAFGQDALASISTGAFANTAFGRQALENLTGGGTNVAVGYRAADGITTGDSNMAIGFRTLSRDNVFNCTAIGSFACREVTGDDNTGIGLNACKGDNTAGGSGTDNTAIGNDSMDRFTTASRNVSIGNTALQELTTGTNNVAVGVGAGNSLSTESENTFLGYNSGRDVTGTGNVFIGQAVGNTLTSVDNELRIANTGGSSTPIISGNMGVAAGENTLGVNILPEDIDSQFHIVTDSGDALPTLKLEQNDDDEAFVVFEGTTEAGTTKSLTSYTSGNTIQGFVRVNINGTIRWMPFYDNPTS